MSTPSGRQVFSDTVMVQVQRQTVCSDSIQSLSAKYLLWKARTSGANVYIFIGAAFDLPSTFLCFCNTCLFIF